MTICVITGCDQPKRASNGMCGMHYQRWRKNGTTELPIRHVICIVEGCARKVTRTTKGLCEAHYYQLRRHGKITSVEIQPYGQGRRKAASTPRTRQPNPALKPAPEPASPVECKEDGCVSIVKTRGWCAMHYTRWARHGDPRVRLPNVGDLPTPTGPDHPRWQGDDIGYSAAHDRVRRQRGPASAHACQHCGGTAGQWAYDHTDPSEQTDGKCGPYSTDLARYIPLCVPCHKRFDLDHLASMAS